MSNCIAINDGVLIETIGTAALGKIGQPPVTLRIERIDRDDFTALVTDIVEAKIVSGSGKIMRKTGKTPLRVIAVRADRAIPPAKGIAPGEIVSGVSSQCHHRHGTAFLEAERTIQSVVIGTDAVAIRPGEAGAVASRIVLICERSARCRNQCTCTVTYRMHVRVAHQISYQHDL
ncbi:MAG: hypothetical protein DID92_2727743293 [Candidatus Nitrotoga sp. SPKER]|nr:MAG: hypothetical protein DID92_2727743293 [Candidatus Nitrotoga sp. SPKER]